TTAAYNPVHRTVVVVTDPAADDDIGGEADEPGVAIVLCRAGFACGPPAEPGCSSGAVRDDALQELHECGAVPVRFFDDGIRTSVKRRPAPGAYAADRVWFDRFAVDGDRIHRRGHVEQSDLSRAERQAGDCRQFGV